MHRCCFVFTKEFPSNNVIVDALKKSDCMYDWVSIGGRYSGLLKIKATRNDKKYRWEYGERNQRNNRLFRSKLIDMIEEFKNSSKEELYFSEEDVFNELGYHDGYIRVDGCLVSDISNKEELSCACFIDKHGNEYSYETWNNGEWKINDDFEGLLKETLKNSEDDYLCVVDLHF